MPASKRKENKPAGPVVLVSSSQRAMRVPRKKLAQLVAFVARKEGRRVAQADIAIVGEGEIKEINTRWLSHRRPTDVISFDLTDRTDSAARHAPGIYAQLVVCADVAVREAKLRLHAPQRELMLYVVHGLLHLMGYDDHTIRGAARMHAREDELLREFVGTAGRRS